MSNLFIKEDDIFTVEIFVANDEKNGTIFCDIDEVLLKEILGNEKEKYSFKKYEVKFKKPSFGDTIELYDSIFSTQDGKNIGFNPIAIRYRKILLLIDSWTLTSSKPTEEDIKSLNPIIANVLGIQLDLETGNLLV
jgi:hypothetical protein